MATGLRIALTQGGRPHQPRENSSVILQLKQPSTGHPSALCADALRIRLNTPPTVTDRVLVSPSGSAEIHKRRGAAVTTTPSANALQASWYLPEDMSLRPSTKSVSAAALSARFTPPQQGGHPVGER